MGAEGLIRESVEARVRRVLQSSAGLESDKLNSSETFEGLGLDSLDVVELCIDIEEEFDVTITDEQMLELKTPQMLIAWLDQQTATTN